MRKIRKSKQSTKKSRLISKKKKFSRCHNIWKTCKKWFISVLKNQLKIYCLQRELFSWTNFLKFSLMQRILAKSSKNWPKFPVYWSLFSRRWLNKENERGPASRIGSPFRRLKMWFSTIQIQTEWVLLRQAAQTTVSPSILTQPSRKQTTFRSKIVTELKYIYMYSPFIYCNQ